MSAVERRCRPVPTVREQPVQVAVGQAEQDHDEEHADDAGCCMVTEIERMCTSDRCDVPRHGSAAEDRAVGCTPTDRGNQHRRRSRTIR